MEQFHKFKKDKKRNDELIMNKFNKFIEPKKDFIDDVWGVIKEFMIEPRYKKSYKFKENTELRYVNSKVDATTFLIGKRYGDLIEVKLLRDDDNKHFNNGFQFYKIKRMEMRRWDKEKQTEDKNDVILLEYISGFKHETIIDNWDGRCYMCYYVIGADKHKNKLWNDEDDENYAKWKQMRKRQEEADYEDYINNIEAMMD